MLSPLAFGTLLHELHVAPRQFPDHELLYVRHILRPVHPRRPSLRLHQRDPVFAPVHLVRNHQVHPVLDQTPISLLQKYVRVRLELEPDDIRVRAPPRTHVTQHLGRLRQADDNAAVVRRVDAR